MELRDLCVTEYELANNVDAGYYILLKKMRSSYPHYYDAGKWAIVDNEDRHLSKKADESGAFEGFFCFHVELYVKPLSYDKKFLDEHRFDSAQDALRFWDENRDKIIIYGYEGVYHYEV